jgi:CheY-like chemotaxis protein
VQVNPQAPPIWRSCTSIAAGTLIERQDRLLGAARFGPAFLRSEFRKNPRSAVFPPISDELIVKITNMSSRIQRLFAPPSDLRIMGLKECNLRPGVLAITADIAFYAQVLSATSSLGWRTEWARWMERAIEVYRPESMPIVIYDVNLPGIEWSQAFDRLRAVPNHPRILLAATRIDEDLWRKVLQRQGYDIVERSASSEEFTRVLHFAWLSLHTPAMV